MDDEVAHDINNLLTVITASLDLLSMDGPDDPNSAELIAMAREACRRLGELTARAVERPD